MSELKKFMTVLLALLLLSKFEASQTSSSIPILKVVSITNEWRVVRRSTRGRETHGDGQLTRSIERIGTTHKAQGLSHVCTPLLRQPLYIFIR